MIKSMSRFLRWKSELISVKSSTNPIFRHNYTNFDHFISVISN
ncbi:unnamed protein product [Acanthoscelides obtectus]|uniref:Uncharacterized protein n=1 Tax=Acanthoscelides obtectus TaxID=200917 RepID=A0A9P0LGV1_ACAOB|nr:unnamed protein product [Acanthoscelides obtectus]CAK1653251.1 hypothetical protein AOBTE_LOCUS18156 [Acanthoscelides obtectus]